MVMVCPLCFSRERGGVYADRNHTHLPVSRILLSRSLSPLGQRLLGQLPHSRRVPRVHRSHDHNRWARHRCHVRLYARFQGPLVSVANTFISVSIYVSARRCSVIYLVPYIHSDNSGGLHSRGRAAAVLYAEQRSSATSVLCPSNANVLPQGRARVNMWICFTLVIFPIKYTFKTFRFCWF